MDLCTGLIGVVAAIFVVTLVGHLLWLLAAAIIKNILSATPPSRPGRRPSEQECARCGERMLGFESNCPACGLDRDGDAAGELRDLEVAADAIDRLLQKSELSPQAASEIRVAIRSRRRALAPQHGGNRRSDEETAAQRLEELLGSCPDARPLTADERRQALTCYRKLARTQLATLSPAALLCLARLLRMAGFSSRVLDVYELLVQGYPGAPEARPGALEAGRFALREHEPDRARRYLLQARTYPLTEAEQAEVERLLTPLLTELVPAEPAPLPVILEEGPPATSPPEVAQTPATRPVQPSPPPGRQSSWGQLLAGFMEERNILWGELIGGMLIVGCSIALVISLWRTLEEIPYFPFLIFAAITAALFGSGLYTLRHWKLESTSRGLLTIATLLTPLDFLVLAGLSQGQEQGPIDWGAELGAIVFFAWMTFCSARVLMQALPGWGKLSAATLLATAVVGASASQLLVPRWLDLAEPFAELFALLSLTPVVLHALAAVLVGVVLARHGPIAVRPAGGLLLFLGQTTFAALVALGFIVYWSKQPFQAFQHLAVAVAIAGLPLLLCGALLNARLDTGEKAAAELRGLNAGLLRWAATAVALGGMAMMLGGLALSWPRPLALVVVGLLNAAVFTAVAYGLRLPHAHGPALASLAVAWLTLSHVLLGALPLHAAVAGRALVHLAISPPSGIALLLLALVLAISSEWLGRLGRRLDALCHLAGSGAAAVLAMLIVVSDDPAHGRGTLVFLSTAIAGLAVNRRWQWSMLTGVCSWILLGGIMHSLAWLMPHWPLSMVATAGLLVLSYLGTGAWLGQGRGTADHFTAPMFVSAVVASLLAAALVLFAIESDVARAVMAGLLAGVWFIMAFRLQQAAWYAAGQGAVTYAVLIACDLWSLEHRGNGLAPYLLGVAALGLHWLLLRRSFALGPGVPGFIEAAWHIVERRLQGLVAILNLLFAWLLLSELTPSRNGWPVWLAQAALALTFLGYLREGRSWAGVMGWTSLAITAPLLLALPFAADGAAGLAARWFLGMAFLAGSALIWSRARLLRLNERLHWPAPADRDLAGQATVLLLFGTVVPVLLMSLGVLIALPELLRLRPTAGFFGAIGPVASYLAPLLLIVTGLAGYGLAERGSQGLLWAGICLTAAVVSGRFVAVLASGQQIDGAEAALLLQLAAATPASWAFCWLMLRQWDEPLCAGVLAFLSFAAHALLFSPPLAQIFTGETAISGFAMQAGALLSWVSWAVLAMTAVWTIQRHGSARPVHVLGMTGIGFAILAGITATRWDEDGWLAIHVLTLAVTLFACGMLVLSWLGSRRPALADDSAPDLRLGLRHYFPATHTCQWVTALAAIAVLLSLAGIWEDPWRPWLSAAVVLSLSGLFGAMALWTGVPGYVPASGLLVNVAGYLIWQAGRPADGFGLLAPVDQFLLSQVLALAASSAAWSLFGRVSDVGRDRSVPFAHLAGVLALVFVASLAAVALAADLATVSYRIPFPLAWWALAATGLSLVLTAWDPTSRFAGLPYAPLYGLGLAGIALALHRLGLPAEKTAWAAGVLGAIFLYEASAVFHFAPRWAAWARALRLPNRALRPRWFLWTQAALGAIVLALSVWMCLTFAAWEDRVFGPLAAALVTAAAVWAVVDWPRLCDAASARVQPLVFATFALALLVLVEAGWMVLDPRMTAPWLHRAAILFTALALGGALYATLARRLLPAVPWRECLGPMCLAVLKLAGAAFLLLLVMEFALYDPAMRRTPLEVPVVAMVAVVLAAAAVAALRVAVTPPAGLAIDDRGRVRLVWLAELIVVAIFLHMRLNRPDWIPAVIGKYWPLLVMALGFAGVGLAELLRRRGLGVIAEPLHRTGIFLPLLPLLAYLVRPLGELQAIGEAVPGVQPLQRNLRNLPEGYFMHALLWFLLGLLYVQVAVMRRTSAFAFLACLAANFGLWVIFAHQHDLSFFLHPQLWLVPLGLIVLTAEHWHRDNLGKAQSAGLRYVGLLLILMSSTADMFITGLGNSVVLPLVLAVLSVAGVLAGILLRVRAFLFLGATFLFLVVFAQIWHAAVDRAQTWVWWASGIVLGAAILTLFAIFEKRRNDVLRLVEELKRWES